MADVTLTQGKVVRMFNSVPDTLSPGGYGCSACAADKEPGLCADLPVNCGTLRVHYVEVP